MAYLKLALALAILLGAFLIFNPTTAMLGSGTSLISPGNSGPVVEVERVAGPRVTLEVYTTNEFEGVSEIQAFAGAIVGVDGVFRSNTNRTGMISLHIPAGNRSIEVSVGSQTWNTWKEFVAINGTTRIQVNFVTIAKRPGPLRVETDFSTQSTRVDTNINLNMERQVYVEGPRLSFITTFLLRDNTTRISSETYQASPWRLAPQKTPSIDFSFTINRPVIYVIEAVINIHWNEAKITEEK